MIAFLKLISLRWWLYLAAASALAFVLWHDHHVSRLLKARNVELHQAQASLTAERDNMRKANEADQRKAKRDAQLERDRHDNPLPAVRVCGPTVRATRSAAKSHAAPEANDPRADAQDRDADPSADPSADPGLDGSVDIGPPLDDFATDAESNLIQCSELQEWVRNRSQ